MDLIFRTPCVLLTCIYVQLCVCKYTEASEQGCSAVKVCFLYSSGECGPSATPLLSLWENSCGSGSVQCVSCNCSQYSRVSLQLLRGRQKQSRHGRDWRPAWCPSLFSPMLQAVLQFLRQFSNVYPFGFQPLHPTVRSTVSCWVCAYTLQPSRFSSCCLSLKKCEALVGSLDINGKKSHFPLCSV